MLGNIYVVKIPSAFCQATESFCRTCLAVKVPSQLYVLGRFLPAPRSVCLGRWVQLSGVSQRLSWQHSTVTSSTEQQAKLSCLPSPSYKDFLLGNESDSITRDAGCLSDASWKKKRHLPTGAMEVNSCWPLPWPSLLKSSAHWWILYTSLGSWSLVANRSGSDWDTCEPGWCRARRSKWFSLELSLRL